MATSYQDTLRRIMAADFTNASEEEVSQALKEVKQACSLAAAVVAVQPLPFVDVVLLSPIQIAEVQAIGRIYGHKLDTRSVLEILSTFGGSVLAQTAVLAAAKLIPFAGWLVGVSMAYALTYAVGEVSDYYFRTGRGADSKELRQLFKRIYQVKRDEKQQRHKGDETLKDKLEQLEEAHRSGLLTEEEFERKKQELLASF